MIVPSVCWKGMCGIACTDDAKAKPSARPIRLIIVVSHRSSEIGNNHRPLVSILIQINAHPSRRPPLHLLCRYLDRSVACPRARAKKGPGLMAKRLRPLGTSSAMARPRGREISSETCAARHVAAIFCAIKRLRRSASLIEKSRIAVLIASSAVAACTVPR